MTVAIGEADRDGTPPALDRKGVENLYALRGTPIAFLLISPPKAAADGSCNAFRHRNRFEIPGNFIRAVASIHLMGAHIVSRRIAILSQNSDRRGNSLPVSASCSLAQSLTDAAGFVTLALFASTFGHVDAK